MSTCNEKVRQLADRLPELIQDLGLGGVFAGMVGMVMPMIDGEVEKLVDMPTSELDELLSQIGEFVMDLRSDERPLLAGEPRPVVTTPVPGDAPTIASLEMTCRSCPAQWEGETSDGDDVLVRFRHDRMSVRVGPHSSSRTILAIDNIDEPDTGGDMLRLLAFHGLDVPRQAFAAGGLD